jgi:regulatory protein
VARRQRGAAGVAADLDLAEVEQVLDQVQAQDLLCERRFVEGFVRTRAQRFGPARLRHELLRRGVESDLIDAAIGPLLSDEFARAHALWLRRFQSAARDTRARASQARFLAARGFSHDVIRRILKMADLSERPQERCEPD